MEDIIYQITCPITGQIFNEPVTGSDGIVYEKDAIELWLKKSSKSPLHGNIINKILYPANNIKGLVDIFLREYPEKKK